MTKNEIEQAYKRSYKDLVRFATRLLRDDERAQDVVQEVFARLLTYKGEVRIETFHTWALKRLVWYIQRHVWLNPKTAKKAELHEVPLEDLKEEGFTPDEPGENEPLKQAIDAAMATLTVKEQEVIAMVVYGRLTFGQVAQSLGADRATIRKRYLRAIQKLKLALMSAGIPDLSYAGNTEL